MKTFTISLLLFLSLMSFGQGEKNIKQQTGSLKAGIGFPAIISNFTFKDYYKGTFDVDILYQYNVFKGLTVGGGFKSNMFQFESYSSSDSNRYPVFMATPILKIGFEQTCKCIGWNQNPIDNE